MFVDAIALALLRQTIADIELLPPKHTQYHQIPVQYQSNTSAIHHNSVSLQQIIVSKKLINKIKLTFLSNEFNKNDTTLGLKLFFTFTLTFILRQNQRLS